MEIFVVVCIHTENGEAFSEAYASLDEAHARGAYMLLEFEEVHGYYIQPVTLKLNEDKK